MNIEIFYILFFPKNKYSYESKILFLRKNLFKAVIRNTFSLITDEWMNVVFYRKKLFK